MRIRDGRISVYDLPVSGYAKALGAWLEKRIGLGGEADIEIAEMVAKVGFSRRTITRALKELIGAGVIRRQPKITSAKGKVASSYTLLDLRPQQATPPMCLVDPSLHNLEAESLEAESLEAESLEAESLEAESQETGTPKTTNAHGFAASPPQPMLDSLFVQHHEHHAAVAVEAPLRERGRDWSRAAEGGWSPRGAVSATPLKLQQLVTDRLREAFRTHAPDFCRGKGIWADLFRAVGELGISLAEAADLVVEIEDADGRDFFDPEDGVPLCPPAEWIEDPLFIIRRDVEAEPLAVELQEAA